MSTGSAISFTDAGGLRFGYLQAGHPGAPLALCLHGFPDSAGTWRHLLPALADAGYHAVAPFLRGYAPTQVPADGSYQLGALVADVSALHDAFGADERAVLVGHDWGAMAAYGAIAFEPDRWARAVTLAVPPVPSMTAAFFDYQQLRRSFYMFVFQTPLAELALSASDFAFIDGLWRDWSPGYEGRADAAAAKDCLRDPASTAAAVGYYRAMFDPSGHLPAYAAQQEAATAATRAGCPVLYVHGADDGSLGVALTTEAEQFLPAGSRRVIIDDAGHFLHLEHPGLIGGLITDWLMTKPSR
jgi:pimeloyl-ACP methyl ester carboxylesterase